MATNPLSPDALLGIIPSLIPSSQTTLSSSIDVLSLLSHSIFISLGFRLSPSSSSSSSSDNNEEGHDNTNANTVLREDWKNNHTYRYRHEQSSMEYEIKCLELGKRGMVHGIALEDNKTTTLDILLSDFFSTSFFPHTIPISTTNSSSASSLAQAFSSPHRLQDLITLFKINILSKLVPGLRKDGYIEETETSSSTSARGPQAGGGSNNNNNDNRQGYYPDSEGPMAPMGGGGGARPYNGPPPLFGGPVGGGNNNPTGPSFIPPTGRSDILPLGGGLHGTLDPLRAGIPGAGVGGGGLGGPGGITGGDGMFVGPDNPLFRDRFGGDWDDQLRDPRGGGGGGFGPVGGGGGMEIPPGARYDPIGPFGGPGRGRGGGFPGMPGGPGMGRGRGGRGPGTGEPDWDDIPPPRGAGFDNMYL